MPVRKEFRGVMRFWKVLRTNPRLRWAYAKIAMGGEERKALQLLTVKLSLPIENVRELYVRMRNTHNRKYAVQETINVLQQIDELAERMNLHSTPWLRNNLRHRKPEDVLQDLHMQAQQVGALAA